MTALAAQLFEQALDLPEEERVSLAHELLDSLASGAPGWKGSEEEWHAELSRRVRSALAGEAGVAWEDVRASARAALKSA